MKRKPHMVDSRRRCQCFLGRYSARYLSLVGDLTPKVLDSCADPGTLGWRDLAGATKNQVFFARSGQRLRTTETNAESVAKNSQNSIYKK